MFIFDYPLNFGDKCIKIDSLTRIHGEAYVLQLLFLLILFVFLILFYPNVEFVVHLLDKAIARHIQTPSYASIFFP